VTQGANKIIVALDAMGGDHGPGVVVPAALAALVQHQDLGLTLVGDELVLRAELARHAAMPENRVQIVHASQRVEMDELPSQALRGKKDSSMRRAIDLVKHGKAAACVSAGNTGALMATGRFVLKMLAGVDRPAIAAPLPSMTGHVYVLDLGANVESSAQQLVQFALMGSAMATAVDGLDRPRVGLLNIGAEEIKGNDLVKDTAQLLAHSDLNYIGYVEGDGIFKGHADVVVCDGFVGNVALKSSEGIAQMIGQFLREEFQRTPLTRLAGLIAMPVLRALHNRIDPREYNGASLLGLRGIVVKSHGSADETAFRRAIDVALAEARMDLPNLITSRIESLLTHEDTV
jgi:glycerol-3-phosphate acyltransferase PlsX